jgi:2-amino-4-hydroxy-6-hydroxymethyldihydropteridine diphosphokinase
VSDLRVSGVRETEPFDVPEPQPPYLNAVVVGDTALGPQALMGELMVIERRALRRRPSPRAPRTLDLDLILFDNLVLDTASLVIPHAGFRERRFVLEPLAELEPEWQDPVTGKTVRALLKQLS